MEAGPAVQTLVALAATVLLAACGSGAAEVETSQELAGTVAPKDALAESPLRPLGGVPLTADGDHIWISDFRQIAVYSREEQRWRTAELPWDHESLGLLNLTNVDGMAVGLVMESGASTARTTSTRSTHRSP